MLKKKLIKLLGGYTEQRAPYVSSHDILTERVKDSFNTIGADDILKEVDGEWIFQDKKIPQTVVNVMKDQASAILEMKVWEVLKSDIQYQSNMRMFLHSQTEQDLIAGKLYLFILDTIESRLKSMAKGKAKINLIK